MYKITNISDDPRKFRIHKSAESFFIRPGEELIVSHKPIIANPIIFKVINLDENKLEEKLKSTTGTNSRKKKLNKEANK